MRAVVVAVAIVVAAAGGTLIALEIGRHIATPSTAPASSTSTTTAAAGPA